MTDKEIEFINLIKQLTPEQQDELIKYLTSLANQELNPASIHFP